jgi:CRP-like cAMP-binding protein
MLSITDIVNTHPFFAGFASAHREKVVARAQVVHFNAGKIIFRSGQTANHFYLLGPGLVSLESAVMEGSPVSIQILGEGEILGWSWFFRPHVWHFDARALEPTHAIAFDAGHLREMCETDELLRVEVMQCMRRILSERRAAVAAEWQ